MAKRSLQDLQRQYNKSAKDSKGGMPMGPRGGRGPAPGGPRGLGGKPKNTGATIKRLWSYVAKYKLKLIFVLFCMLFSTVTSLIGSFSL